MTNLFAPPQVFDLPLSKGGDLLVDFIYKPDGVVTDYPGGASVKLTIETDTPLLSTATITDEHAVVLVDKVVSDEIPKGKFWRAVITYSDGTDVVMCNGKTVRKDGAA